MKIRKIKKDIKNLNDKIFKSEALKSLKLIKKWSCINDENSKRNMNILTQNFIRKGSFINNGVW